MNNRSITDVIWFGLGLSSVLIFVFLMLIGRAGVVRYGDLLGGPRFVFGILSGITLVAFIYDKTKNFSLISRAVILIVAACLALFIIYIGLFSALG